MKKYLAFVLALVMALSLVACGNKTAEEPSGDGDATEAAGRVFWLNFKPEADGTLQKVAAMYTEKNRCARHHPDRRVRHLQRDPDRRDG